MMRYGLGYGGYGMMGGTGGFIMTLFMLLVLALVILGIVALLRYVKPGAKILPGTDDNALNILKERYARGEINDEEYAAKKTMLTNK